MQQESQAQSLSVSSLLLIIVIGLWGFFLFLSNGLSGNGSPGSSFDAKAEAFQLAKETQAYRQAHPQQSNYGLASITVFLNDGSSQRYVPLDNKGAISAFAGYGGFTTHSEAYAHGWIIGMLRSLKKSGKINANVVSIALVIFSQVIVCQSCRIAMKSWQKEFRQEVGFDTVSLSIWQLTNGYDPARLPQGRLVTSIDDVAEVPIAFDTLNPVQNPITSQESRQNVFALRQADILLLLENICATLKERSQTQAKANHPERQPL